MAMFMTSNKLEKEDIIDKAETLSFPESVRSLFKGEIGQPHNGFPQKLQKAILKEDSPYTSRPNEYLEPIDLEGEFESFKQKYGPYVNYNDFLSSQLYPQVFEEFFQHYDLYGVVRTLPTPAFFYGLKENEEILIELGEGKNLLVQYVNCSKPDAGGDVMVYFKLNGQSRVIPVFDKSSKVERKVRRKAEKITQIGSPLQGSLSSILVKEGQKVEVNDPLFVIEAMKMESTVTAPMDGEIIRIYLAAKELVDQDDLVLEIDPVKEAI